MKRLLFLVLALTVHSQAGSIRLPPVFSNNMVLQSGMPVPVWGEAKPGMDIVVEFAGRKAQAKADATGSWRVTLDSMPISFDERSLIISSSGESLILTNVLVGEVWLCAGQSNMDMPLEVYKEANRIPLPDPTPEIRFNRGRTPDWVVTTDESKGSNSAAAHFFAVELSRHVHAPIGLIVRAHGGTPLEHWAPADALRTLPYVRAMEARCADPALADARERHQQAYKEFREALTAWRALTPEERKNQPAPKAPGAMIAEDISRADYDWYKPKRIGYGYRQSIEKVIPFGIRGVIWYQGETNGEITGGPEAYRDLLPLLIRSWREAWGQGDFPFLYVQLPVYNRENWTLLRESMLKSLSTPHTGMAITIDSGHPNDIHPANKPEVGRRLALLARKLAYKQDIVASGPVPTSWRIDGDRIEVAFEHVGSGLTAQGGDLTGFVIAGEDGNFIPAQARIDGNRVIIWSDEVEHPQAARYAWAANPEVSLFNSEGLPASPFRTDG